MSTFNHLSIWRSIAELHPLGRCVAGVLASSLHEINIVLVIGITFYSFRVESFPASPANSLTAVIN
jgi:hypothetical protein